MDMSIKPAEIKVFDDEMEEGEKSGVARELPRYKCHKEVWALKIKEIKPHRVNAIIVPCEEGYEPFRVDADYVRNHKPQPGGYYVVYADGYRSYSPPKAFEDGYTRVP